MDLFSLIDENGPLHPVSPDLIRRLQHRSPSNSPSRLSMPELSETDQSASEGEKDLPNVSCNNVQYSHFSFAPKCF